MLETVMAVYEKGLLRPLQPISLRESETVRLQVLPADESDAALQLLVAAGLVTPPADQSDVAPVPDAERHEIADLLGQSPGKPLSELVIEDRGEW